MKMSGSMEYKIDKVIEVQMAIQLDLREHMHRTILSEDRIEKLEDSNDASIRRIHAKLDDKVGIKLFFWGIGASTMLVTIAIAIAKLLV